MTALRARALLWWTGRSRREQRLLGGLGAVLLLALIAIVVVRPLQAARAEALAEIRSLDAIDARIREAGLLTGGGQPRIRTGAPAELASSTAAGVGLSLDGITPGEGGVTVRLTGKPYDVVLRWLNELSRTTPLRVAAIDLRRGSLPGGVDGEVELR